MEMHDMKRPFSKEDSWTISPGYAMALDLDEDTLEKLGKNPKDFKLGDTVVLVCKTVVSGVLYPSKLGLGAVEVTITGMAIKPEPIE